MEPMKPEVMIRQVRDLPVLTRAQTAVFDANVQSALPPDLLRTVERVFITGDGDSYHAARAMELFFEEIAGIPCHPMSAQRFLDYGAEFAGLEKGRALVIAISASGRTERGLQAMRKAQEIGSLTVALTGTPGSAFTETGEKVVLVNLPDFGRSPGIRTYNASLMGLGLIAARMGEAHGSLDGDAVAGLYQELLDLAPVMERTLEAVEAPANAAADPSPGCGARGPARGRAPPSARGR